MPSSPKRASDDSDADYANKAPRLDVHGAEYAGNISRRKSAATTRTGQACDRCKLRKIRCDVRPGGCSPCAQNQTECKTTDRITGRATSRGHTENLENENTTLRLYMIELQAQLKEHGHEPRPQPPIHQPPTPTISSPAYPKQAFEAPQGLKYFEAPQRDRHELHPSRGSLLPDFRDGCIGDNYLGVSSENSFLSSIEGNSLSLFSTKIDLAEFMPEETPATSAMSYQTFLAYAFGQKTPPKPELPEWASCKLYADWFFRSVHMFLPILHKPDLMQLLSRIYHEGYQPTTAEVVMVHMMLAVIDFQLSLRNGDEQSRDRSFEHYHYSLSFVPQLIESHKLEDLQALTLICSQLRNQPRSGAAWMFTNLVVGIAIESGFHRSVKAWRGSSLSPHTIEMRKRIFWALMTFHVCLSGKLGRPMPLRFEDFDVEIPEAVQDTLPGENVSEWKRCSFRASIQGSKILKILMSVYSTIYSVKSGSAPYETQVRQIDQELEAFQAQVPPELNGGPQTREEDRSCALFLRLGEDECRLLLHHPALCRSTSAQTSSRNLDICLEASSRMLQSALQLKALKGLDTTLYHSTVYLAAIFTTLFAYSERRDYITSADLQKLRQDMNLWLEVMGEVGNMLGTGAHLQNTTRRVIDTLLTNINRYLAARTASAAVTSSTSSLTQGQSEPRPQMYEQDVVYSNSYSHGPDGDSEAGTDQHRPYSINHNHEQTARGYQANHDAYTEPQNPTYASSNMSASDSGAYAADRNKATLERNIEAQLNGALGPPAPRRASIAHMTHHNIPPTPGFTMGYQQPLGRHDPNPGVGSMAFSAQAGDGGYIQFGGPEAWRMFANSLPVNITAAASVSPTLPHEHAPSYLASTNALMAIHGNGANSGMQMPSADGHQTWPLIQFDTGNPVDGQ